MGTVWTILVNFFPEEVVLHYNIPSTILVRIFRGINYLIFLILRRELLLEFIRENVCNNLKLEVCGTLCLKLNGICFSTFILVLCYCLCYVGLYVYRPYLFVLYSYSYFLFAVYLYYFIIYLWSYIAVLTYFCSRITNTWMFTVYVDVDMYFFCSIFIANTVHGTTFSL